MTRKLLRRGSGKSSPHQMVPAGELWGSNVERPAPPAGPRFFTGKVKVSPAGASGVWG